MVEIKGFAMPETCADCDFSALSNCGDVCSLKSIDEWAIDIFSDTRDKDCPLVEIDEK